MSKSYLHKNNMRKECSLHKDNHSCLLSYKTIIFICHHRKQCRNRCEVNAIKNKSLQNEIIILAIVATIVTIVTK